MKAPSLIVDPTRLRLQYLIPDEEQVTFVVQTVAEAARCPRCQRPSTRVHSRYRRRIADLPWNGLPVTWELRSRRFFCETPDCAQGIFAERLDGVLSPFAHRTLRLEEALLLVALVLGGEAGSRLAREWGVRVSPDTLLRLVKARLLERREAVRFLGVDDFAFRKGHRYGTILIDLEAGQVLDLLPDRQAEALTAWLREHPEVELICRDRAEAYGQAARAGAPQAKQVADRWHLLHSVVTTLTQTLTEHRALLKAASAPEAAALSALTARAPPLDPVACAAEASPRRRGKRRRGRPSQAAPYEGYLKGRWEAGCTNASQLFRELQALGFRGSCGAVGRFVASWRKPRPPRPKPPRRKGRRTPRGAADAPPKLKEVTWWLLRTPEELTASQALFLKHLRQLCPPLVQAEGLAREFFRIVRERDAGALPTWQQAVEKSGLRAWERLGKGLNYDQEAVEAALTETWSNGPTEGHVNRLKLIKRQMYGRASFELLRARVLLGA